MSSIPAPPLLHPRAASRRSTALRSTLAVLVAAALAPSLAARPGGDGCQAGWEPTFGSHPGLPDGVGGMTVFDAGQGPELVLSGFEVASWNGTTWTEISAEQVLFARVLCTYDGGGGTALYAAGDFTTIGDIAANRIARWDGTGWSGLGTGLLAAANAMAVHDDGSGAALYVGGAFNAAGGVPALRIARWDGASWSAVGGGIEDDVSALAVFDDGTGTALYAGGAFSVANGSFANHVARWDGTSWSAVGGGTDAAVVALAVFDDGGGPALYAGGAFANAGGAPARHVARWDGTAWSAVGNLSSTTGSGTGVFTLASIDLGNGPALYAGGRFQIASTTRHGIARWDGASWAPVGLGVGTQDAVRTLARFDAGNGPELFAGGTITTADASPVKNVARWNGSAWSRLGPGLDDHVRALCSFEDANGPALFVGGGFVAADGLASSRLLRWDGASWSGFGGQLSAGATSIEALEVVDLGAGPVLFAGGLFHVFATGARDIAAWTGSGFWQPVGVLTPEANRIVRALAGHDDGSGPALYAGGEFAVLGGVPATNVARWDGTSWSPLGEGLGVPGGPAASGNSVRALATFDEGAGPTLFAAGAFLLSDTTPVTPINRVARWNGSSWSAVGTGTSGPVNALVTFDDGTGTKLYAGGSFTQAGGAPARNVACWDGSSWSRLDGGTSAQVHDLCAFDDGSGPALYAAGDFDSASGAPARGIARWNGTSWTDLGDGLQAPRAKALAAHDAGAGPALYVGGAFMRSDGGDSYLARWQGCERFPSFCDGGDGSLAACPCGNAGSPDTGCDIPQATGGVRLDVLAQTTSPNAATLRGTGFWSAGNPVALVVRSPALDPARPVVFGDGVRCVGMTPLVRLAPTQAVLGASSHVVGHSDGAGTFHYQLWFRSNPSTYCDAGAAFNLSSGRSLTW